MKCLKCGAELQETDAFCPKCGEKVVREEPKEETSNLGTFTYERPTDQGSNELFFNDVQADNTQTSNAQASNAQMSNAQTNNNNTSKQKKVNSGAQQNTKKKSNTWIILLVVAVVIVAIVGGLAFFIKSTMDSLTEKWSSSGIFGDILDDVENGDLDALEGILSGNSNTGNENENTILNITSSDDTTATIDKETAKQVDFEGFRLYIPNELTYTNTDSLLKIENANPKWVASFNIDEGDAVEYMTDNSMMRAIAVKIFNAQGAKITNSATITKNGVKYAVFEGTLGGEDFVFALTGVDSDHMAYIILMTTDGNASLSTISEIIKNAEYIGE